MAYMSVMGPCWSCGEIFWYSPTKVPSIKIKDGTPDPEGVREPICEPCMIRTNVVRQEMGLEPHTIPRGAYEADEV
jgi:hypothetical protein